MSGFEITAFGVKWDYVSPPEAALDFCFRKTAPKPARNVGEAILCHMSNVRRYKTGSLRRTPVSIDWTSARLQKLPD